VSSSWFYSQCALSTEITHLSSCHSAGQSWIWTQPVQSYGSHPSFGGQNSGRAFHLPVRHRRGFAVAAPQPLAEAYGEQAVDDGVQAGVEKPKDEQDVGEGVGDFPLQVVRKEPVPQTQQVVRSPADYEADHYDDAHFQSSHPGFGDVVLGASEMWLVGGRWRKEREREREIEIDGVHGRMAY